MPLLTELGLQQKYHDIFFETLLARLTYRETGDSNMDCLVPKLEVIALDPSFNGQSFLDMIQSRWRLKEGGSSAKDNTSQVTRLKEVDLTVYFYYPLDSNVITQIREFSDEGLSLFIRKGNSYYH